MKLLKISCFFGLLACLSACTQSEGSEAVDSTKVSLEEWKIDVDNSQMMRLKSYENSTTIFKNGTRLISWKEREFMVSGQGLEACVSWTDWARSQGVAWNYSISVRGQVLPSCPTSGFLFTMTLKKSAAAASLPVLDEPLTIGNEVALSTAKETKPATKKVSASPLSWSGFVQNGKMMSLGKVSTDSAADAIGEFRTKEGFSLVEIKRESCPVGFFGSVVFERSRATENDFFGKWKEKYRGCLAGCGVSDEEVKEIEDRMVEEYRPCSVGGGVERWVRSESRERFSQCLSEEEAPTLQDQSLQAQALQAQSWAFGRIWGPWIPESEWVLERSFCSKLSPPPCNVPPPTTEIRRSSCPSGQVGYIDEVRPVFWACSGDALFPGYGSWIVLEVNCQPCNTSLSKELKTELKTEWRLDRCEGQNAIESLWVFERNECSQDDRVLDVGSWARTGSERVSQEISCQ